MPSSVRCEGCAKTGCFQIRTQQHSERGPTLGLFRERYYTDCSLVKYDCPESIVDYDRVSENPTATWSTATWSTDATWPRGLQQGI